MSQDNFLASLNQSQNEAVTFPISGQLSILAGPGSGKTHTLTSRTAWLLSQGTPPSNIVVTTFTVKSAREMRERIGHLIGMQKASKLILGTFHSISRRYLVQYGYLINIQNNFGIADSADSLAIIKRVVKRCKLNIDPKVARTRISHLKARGSSKKQKEARSGRMLIENQDLEICHCEYESALRRSNLLDYDDLLLKCVDLLREHPECVANVEAVLIDEFQDTNIVQFLSQAYRGSRALFSSFALRAKYGDADYSHIQDLMRLFAAHRKQITIVGDPDQSIYSFRAAEIQNYKRMLHHYPESININLKENYRSSGAILFMALKVIEQDNGRTPRPLLPTHCLGIKPVLRQLSNAHEESEWISTEIKRLIGMTGGLLDLGDFSILLRSAALSRLIESSLGHAGLPYKMVGGARFYDRVEVRVTLDYLRVVIQPDNDNALSSILNFPSRRIGDTTIKKLMEEAHKNNHSLWSFISEVVQGKNISNANISKQVNQGLSCIYDIIMTAKNKLLNPDNPISLADLLKYILKKTKMEEWLEVHYNDTNKSRWSNIEELIIQVSDFQDHMDNDFDDEALPSIDCVQQKGKTNILSKFLDNVALASESKNDDKGNHKSQITISTIHAAKGLEWPVVFIPAVYQGSIPHSRAEDLSEERRLLYVAMTRAKVLLYLSRPMKNSQGEATELTEFLSFASITPLVSCKGPAIQSTALSSISRILGRPIPTTEAISKSLSLLLCEPDDTFPLSAKDVEEYTGTGSLPVERGIYSKKEQKIIKRRRIKYGETGLDHPEEFYDQKTSPESKSGSVGFSQGSGFISAGSHLKSLDINSITRATECNQQRVKPPDKKGSLYLSKSQLKVSATGQKRTLLTYFGKFDSVSTEELNINKIKNDGNIEDYHIKPLNVEASMPRIRDGGLTSVLDSLPLNIHGKNEVHGPQKVLSDVPPKLNSLNSQPLPINAIDISAFSDRLTATKSMKIKKTLGVKRSMDSWSVQKRFVPPKLIKKPPPA